MHAIIIDAQTREKLGKIAEPVYLKDEKGQVFGHFVPIAPGALEPRISQEELDRRERAGGGRSLKEILADLEKRA